MKSFLMWTAIASLNFAVGNTWVGLGATFCQLVALLTMDSDDE